MAQNADNGYAQQLVQNRVSQAEPRLPDAVRTLGVTTIKSSPDLMMVVHILSPDNKYDITYLRNYAGLNVKDRLARIAGVGDVQLFGSGDYAMRVWLDPQKVAEHGLSAVRGYLQELAELHRWLDSQGKYEADRAIVTAGGSAYFDLVAEELGALVDREGARGIPTTVVLR